MRGQFWPSREGEILFFDFFLERKSMSTKTTFKRVALVAVVALGLGGLSTVAANATHNPTDYVTGISASTAKAPVAGATGQVGVTTFTFTSESTTSTVITPRIVISSAPSTSALIGKAPTAANGGITEALGAWSLTSTAPTVNASTRAIASGATDFTEGADLTLSTANSAGYETGKLYATVAYDVPGTYVFTAYDDVNGNGIVDGTDYVQNFTVVVAAQSATQSAVGSVTAVNSASSTTGTYGSLIKVALKDAAGNPIAPDQNTAVTVSLTGSAKIAYVNNSSITAASSTTLGATAFNGKGIAYLNVTDATAESVVVSLSAVGFGTFSAGTAATLSFTAPVSPIGGSGSVTAATAGNISSSSTYNYKGATVSVYTNGTSSSTSDDVVVGDISGDITGSATAHYDLVVAGGGTAASPNFSLTIPAGAVGDQVSITSGTGSALTLTAAAQSTYTSTLNGIASVIRAAQGSVISIPVTVKNQFGAAAANVSVSATIAGRNSAVTVASGVTDASGHATLTYTDASTSTTALTDTVSITPTASLTVNYSAASNLGVTKVVLTSNQTDATGADLPNLSKWSIGTADLGVEGTLQTVSAKVTDVNGVGLAGIPVKFSISGTGAAVLSTTQTVYTGAAGTASASVYAWKSGSYVVTAAAGTVSSTVNAYFVDSTAANTRNITVAAGTTAGSVVATATDRFGNPVSGVVLNASTTGGYFGSGSTTATGTTETNGTVTFILLAGSGDVTVSYDSSNAADAQLYAPAGQYDSTAGDTYTPTTVGTATTAETGVGASYAPAGNSKAVLAAATANTVAQDQASAATDAANEATDAANAATDAANAAADAADAATSAAQDASAQAQAALAAVNALSAKITVLAAQIAKIVKKLKA